jgi:hypothetical protein
MIWDRSFSQLIPISALEEAPPDGLSACETFRACPDCGGDVGAVEDAPSDASSDVDLPPLGGTSNDDDSD